MINSRKNNSGASRRSFIVFLDSSVILSALASPSGGSRKILQAVTKGKLQLFTTPFVIEEVAKHLHKLGVKPNELEILLKKKVIRVISDAPQHIIKKFHSVTVDPDDAPVLAGAVLSGSHVLVSLDKGHILTDGVRKALKPLLVFSPKEFWGWLQEHRSTTIC